MAGEHDELVTPRPARGLARTFPDAEAVLVRRARHQLNVLNPATVASCIEAFATRRGAPAPPAPSGLRALVTAALRRVLALIDALCGIAVVHTPLEHDAASPMLKELAPSVPIAPSLRRRRSVSGM